MLEKINKNGGSLFVIIVVAYYVITNWSNWFPSSTTIKQKCYDQWILPIKPADVQGYIICLDSHRIKIEASDIRSKCSTYAKDQYVFNGNPERSTENEYYLRCIHSNGLAQ